MSCNHKTTSFAQLGKVTKIEVTGTGGAVVKKIVDGKRIAQIVAFVDKNAAGWGGANDWAGVPVPQIVANFYEGANFKGHFGVGANFFETQRDGDFLSKSASDDARAEFLDLIKSG